MKENMNAERFVDFLEDYVLRAVRQKRIRRPIILMDNARPHTADIVTEFIKTHHWEVLSQDPYSLDENPADSDGFARIKNPLRGRRYSTFQTLVAAFDEVIDDLNEKRIFNGITHLEKTWKAIIQNNGDYIN